MSNNCPQTHFSVYTATTFSLLLGAAFLIAGAAAPSAFAATGTSSSNGSETAKTSKAAVAQEFGADADIGTVTRLALAVTVEEYRKKLRELRQNSAPAVRGGPALTDPLVATGAPAPAPERSVKPEKQAPQIPQISSISGPSGSLVAVLAGGRPLRQGDVVQLANVRWTVQGITTAGVRFERCDGGRSCQEQIVPVSGRV